MNKGTYKVTTFGCQMNAHDSERLAGLLQQAGFSESLSDFADVIVLNTCAVRENADNKLYGTLGMLVQEKEKNPKSEHGEDKQ
jgi:tRNA-2-methylthio-N6-dimethylallyladenosine synthase